MVRPILFTLLLSILCLTFGLAQQRVMPALEPEPNMTKWRLTTMEFTLGVTTDRYNSMSLDQISAFANNPAQIQRDVSGMEEVVSTTASGLGFFAQVGFSPADFSKGEYKDNRLIRVGIGIHSPKEAMVTYRDQGRDTSIVYCNLYSELSLEAAYIFKGRWGKRWNWNWGFDWWLSTPLG